LFDVMMGRFDIFNENRVAVISIANAVTLDPKQIFHHFPNMCHSIARMVEVAEVEESQLIEHVKNIVLTGVYFNSFRVWINDNSGDMAATMATLDKGLSILEKINF